MDELLLRQPVFLLGLIVVISIFALVTCSKYLIDGSVALARILRISPLIIGTTVVGMGTSIDELMVNLSVLHQKLPTDIVMGNILGSNMVNLALGLGIPALLTTITATMGIIEKEIPIYLALGALLTSFAIDNRLTQAEGLVFVAIFGAIMYLIYQNSKRDHSEQLLSSGHKKAIKEPGSVGRNLVYVFGGLGLMMVGSRLLVASAAGIATQLGVSAYVISLTIVGVGTSLPEILASIQAARRKNSDMVLGNVLGSNIFNLCFGLGVPMLVTKIIVTPQAMQDIYFLNLVGVVMVFLLLIDGKWFGRSKNFSRAGGLILMVSYVAYMSWKVANG